MGLICVSNRLASTVEVNETGTRVKTAKAGGLATAMAPVLAARKGTWVGWLGHGRTPEIDAALQSVDNGYNLQPVWLTANELRAYYDQCANARLWPTFHGMPGRAVRTSRPQWDEYFRVNRKFAREVRRVAKSGDTVWVHDYHLLPLPRLLESKRGVKVGFFLHIPWPTPEMFWELSMAGPLLDGVLGADLIGFQTEGNLGRFLDTAGRQPGTRVTGNTVSFRGHITRLGVYPIGIDPREYTPTSEEREAAAAIRQKFAGQRLLLGVDRLDYSKGLPRRVEAVGRMLELHPELAGTFRLLQIAVLSRTDTPAYREEHRALLAAVERVNTRFGTAGWTPVEVDTRNFERSRLRARYVAAHAMVVSSFRDGMHLGAKEYCVAGPRDGALVLSTGAGAWQQLGPAGAIGVEPNSTDSIARGIHTALMMPESERRCRMAGLALEVESNNVHRWAGSFLADLEDGGNPFSQGSGRPG